MGSSGACSSTIELCVISLNSITVISYVHLFIAILILTIILQEQMINSTLVEALLLASNL